MFPKCGNRILHPKSHTRRKYFKTYDGTSPVTLQSLFSWVSALPQAPAGMIYQVTILPLNIHRFSPSSCICKSVAFERRAPFPLLFQDTLLMFSKPLLHITSKKMMWIWDPAVYIQIQEVLLKPPLLPFWPHGFPKTVRHKRSSPHWSWGKHLGK